jgi:hypothetical protein
VQTTEMMPYLCVSFGREISGPSIDITSVSDLKLFDCSSVTTSDTSTLSSL